MQIRPIMNSERLLSQATLKTRFKQERKPPQVRNLKLEMLCKQRDLLLTKLATVREKIGVIKKSTQVFGTHIPDGYLTPLHASKVLLTTAQYVWAMIKKDNFPAYVLSNGAVVLKHSDLVDYMKIHEEHLNLDLNNAQALKLVSLSLGLATFPPSCITQEELTTFLKYCAQYGNTYMLIVLSLLAQDYGLGYVCTRVNRKKSTVHNQLEYLWQRVWQHIPSVKERILQEAAHNSLMDSLEGFRIKADNARELP